MILVGVMEAEYIVVEGRVIGRQAWHGKKKSERLPLGVVRGTRRRTGRVVSGVECGERCGLTREGIEDYVMPENVRSRPSKRLKQPLPLLAATHLSPAQISLAILSQTCNAALQPSESQPTTQPIQVLHKDLTTLCSFLYAATTKLSLALKPSSPTYAAALTPLKDLSDHVSALFHCASHFVADTHGAILVQEVASLVKDVISSIRDLAQKFLDIEANDARRDSGQAGDEYLVRTAAVHAVLERARRLSPNNLSAVRKRWSEDAASLDDGLREVADMIDEAESESPHDDFDDSDDGWAEIGIEKSRKMVPEEMERTKKVRYYRVQKFIFLFSATSGPRDTTAGATLAQAHLA